MTLENRRKNGRKIILGLCLMIFVLLGILSFSGTSQSALHSEKLTLESQQVNQDLLNANEEYLHLIQALNEELVRRASVPKESEQIVELRRQVEDLQDFLNAKSEDRTEFENKIQELTEALERKNEQLDEFRDQLLVSEDELSQVNELQKALNDRREQLELARQEIQDLKNNYNEKSQSFNKLVQLINEHQETIANLQRQVQYEIDRQNSLRQEMAQLSQERDHLLALGTEVDLLKSELEEKSIQLKDAEDDLDTSENTIVGLRGVIQQKEKLFQANIEIEEKRKRDLRETIATLQQENTQLSTKAEKLMGYKDLYTTQSEELEKIKQELEIALKDFATIKDTLIDTSAKMAYGEKKHQQEKEKFNKEKNELIFALEENAETISRLENQLKDKEITFQTSLEQNRTQINSLKDNVEQLKTHNQQLLTRAQDLEEELKIKNQQITQFAGYERKYEEERKKRLIKEQVLKQLHAQLDRHKHSLNKLESTRKGLEDELAMTQDSYSQLAKEAAKRQPSPGITKEVVISEPRHHIVQSGETLMHISAQYYGTTKKWKRILEANRDVIPNENKINPGIALAIP